MKAVKAMWANTQKNLIRIRYDDGTETLTTPGGLEYEAVLKSGLEIEDYAAGLWRPVE